MKKCLVWMLLLFVICGNFDAVHAGPKNIGICYPNGNKNLSYHTDGKHMNTKQDMAIALSGDREVRPPSSYVSNGASIPSWMNWLIPKRGKYDLAAIVHDFLYVGDGMVWKDGIAYRPTRKEADDIFLELMERYEVVKWRREAMYKAVRVFGNSPLINKEDRWKE